MREKLFRGFHLDGKKIKGEFVCDYIDECIPDYNPITQEFFNYVFWDKMGNRLEDCLSCWELEEYAKGQALYGWQISDLKIYDKPKELSEFYKSNEIYCNNCKYMTLPPNRKATSECDRYCSKYNAELDFYDWFLKVEECTRLTRPPQSWCYVEELEE